MQPNLVPVLGQLTPLNFHIIRRDQSIFMVQKCVPPIFYRLIANYGQITTPKTKSNLIVLIILIYKSHAHLTSTPYLQKWIHFHHFYLPCTHFPSAYQVQKVIKEGSFRFTGNSLNRPYSLQLQRAMRANTAEKWFQRRGQKYGPISKLSLFGKPTVLIYGQAENKFIFTSDSITLAKAKHKLWRGFWGINVWQNSVDKITSVSGMLLYHFWSLNHWNIMWGKWMRKSGCIWRRVGKENKSRFIDEVYHEWIALCLRKTTKTSFLCSLKGLALNQGAKIQYHLLSSIQNRTRRVSER